MKAKILANSLFALTLISASVSKSESRDIDPDKGKIRVAVIDTGLDPEFYKKPFLCKRGHKDFTGTGFVDRSGHGTNISGLIEQNAKDMYLDSGASVKDILEKKMNYCQIIIKFYDPKFRDRTGITSILAIKHAISLKVDIINFSAGGTYAIPEEAEQVTRALNLGIKMVVAAGNEGSDLMIRPYYPASYDNRIIVVGNWKSASERNPSSNFGPNVVWELGTKRISFGINGKMSAMTGTSQATAVHTGKIIKQMLP